MEKFGIFELLDALAALTEAPPEAEKEQTALDPAYLPPDYAGAQPEKAAPSEPPKPPKPEADALAGFYARHDAIAKKAKK